MVSLAIALGCASPPPANTLAPGHEGAPGVEKVLAVAPNMVLALPAELRSGTGALRRAMDAYLEAHGRGVQWLSLYQAKQVWSRAMLSAKDEGAIERTPVFFAAELAESYEFDALVMPSILLHRARASASAARWDGVRRRMRVVNAPRRGVGREQDTLADGIAHGGINHDVAVTSVHLMVFSPEGERIFEGRGGLEMTHEIDMADLHIKRTFDFRLRGDLFADRTVMREGVEIAFRPYLASLPTAER